MRYNSFLYFIVIPALETLYWRRVKKHMAENLAKFDPEAHPDGVYKAFNEFLKQYEYD